jgi:GNAT superfamily N-acetyltransferase
MTRPELTIRRIGAGDPVTMAAAFRAIGWYSKSESLFERYRAEQDGGDREVLLAREGSVFTGYVTVQWAPKYRPLAASGTPEVQDLNVLPSFRRRGIGTQLIVAAERVVRERSGRVGIAVGLHPGYNGAQRLYGILGYVPDGNGITAANRAVAEGESIVLGDDVVLHLEKTFGR